MLASSLKVGRPSPAEPPTMIIVAVDARDRQAIQRMFPGFEFQFAATVEEAEMLARTERASGFYVF